jgi:phosphohistidine phosphatase
MKTLHLLRHAKSSWDQPGLADRERALNARGSRDAPRMGAALGERLGALPVRVSPAKRAQLTLAGLLQCWPALASLPHRTEEQLYSFDYGDLVSYIEGIEENNTEIFIIGHNPALTELINYCDDRQYLANLPTAGYAQLYLAIDHWKDIHPGCGTLQLLLKPSQLA